MLFWRRRKRYDSSEEQEVKKENQPQNTELVKWLEKQKPGQTFSVLSVLFLT